MQDRIQITALRDCMFLALFTDADNRDIGRKWIDLNAGESRGDVQFVLGIDPQFTDFSEEYSDLALEMEMIGVSHPHCINEVTQSHGVLQLRRLS